MSVLDDIFSQAPQLPVRAIVDLAMATNELSNGNRVTYAEGLLYYSPESFKHVGAPFLWLPASFSSQQGGIRRYYSDRTSGGFGGSQPFDANDTDQLTVAILALQGGNYRIAVHSMSDNLTFSFAPSIDSSTGVVLGSNGSIFITISLCNLRGGAQ
jgi:hypothetical protein